MFSRTLKALLLSSMLTGCVLAGRPAAAQGTSAANINRALDTLNRIAQLIDSIQNRQTTQVSELERSDYLTPERRSHNLLVNSTFSMPLEGGVWIPSSFRSNDKAVTIQTRNGREGRRSMRLLTSVSPLQAITTGPT